MEENTVFYVVGVPIKHKSTPVVMSTMTKFSLGWKQRSIEKGYDNDYVSRETLKTLKEWFACDFSTFKIFKNFEDARSNHSTLQKNTVAFFD